MVQNHRPRRHHLTPHTSKRQGCVREGAGLHLDPPSESFVEGFQSGDGQNREPLGGEVTSNRVSMPLAHALLSRDDCFCNVQGSVPSMPFICRTFAK